MNQLSSPFLATLLSDQALILSEERLLQAVATHAQMRTGLEQLRSLELSFLEPVVEPATALAWLERGPGEEEQ
jgi:MFS transporter, DHA1 family, multidrug resistance protein